MMNLNFLNRESISHLAASSSARFPDESIYDCLENMPEVEHRFTDKILLDKLKKVGRCKTCLRFEIDLFTGEEVRLGI